MRCDDFTYDELLSKLGGMDCETHISAAEHFYISEVEGNKFKTVFETWNSTFRWVNTMTGLAGSLDDALRMICRTTVRSWFVPQFREYMDQKEVEGDREFIARVYQWNAAWGKHRPIFSRRDKRTTPYTNPVAIKKTLTCCLCGKVGHIARDCWGMREEEVDGPSK